MGVNDDFSVDRHEGKYYDRSRAEKYKKQDSDANKIKTKKCRVCETSKSVTKENFYRDKDKKDGFQSVCKECEKKRYRERKKLKTNKIKVKEKMTKELNKEDTYEWVKSLPKERKDLLDPEKISAKIKEELFGKTKKVG